MSITELTSIPETDAGHRTVAEDAEHYCDAMELSLHPVSPRGWLVVDARSACSGGRLLGCIDEVVDGYELMEIVDGFRWTVFDSLLAAATHLQTVRRQFSRDASTPVPGDERRFHDRIDGADALIDWRVSR